MGLRDQTIKGFLWSASGTLGSGVFSFVISMILARLLTPSDFGLMEIILVISIISNVFLDSGFSQAIIRDKNASQKDLSSVFYFNILSVVIIYFVLFFIASILSDIYGSKELIILSRVLFIKLIFDAFSIVQVSNSMRLLDFKPLAKASIYAMIASGIISVIAAYLGAGIWALVLNNVCYSLFKCISIWIMFKWRPSLEFSLESVKKYFKFGVNILIISVLDKSITSMESLAIGKVYSKQDLGNFAQARKFDSLIVQTLVGIIQKVTYPALSKVDDTVERLKNGYLSVIRIMMFCMMPIVCITIVSARDFVQIVFGEQWINVANYLRIFSLYSLIYPIHSICNNIYYIRGESRSLLYVNIVQQTLRLSILFSTIKYGVFIFSCGVVISSIIGAAINITFAGKLINYSIIKMITDLKESIIAIILIVAYSLIITEYLCDWNMYLRFVFVSTTMLALYLSISIFLKNPTIYQLKLILKGLVISQKSVD